jgi:hypothetical protein
MVLVSREAEQDSHCAFVLLYSKYVRLTAKVNLTFK